MTRVFLDTCVLYPPILRGFLLGLAEAGLYQPLWSQGVAAEWLHVTARRGEPGAADTLARMAARWPDAMTPSGDPDWFDLPDPQDRHILAAAIAGQASQLCTLNLRDFPRRALAAHAIHAVSPDDLAMGLWLESPHVVETQVARTWPPLAARPLRNALKRARLPRLGKALSSE